MGLVVMSLDNFLTWIAFCRLEENGLDHLIKVTCLIPKEYVISLLGLVLNYCVCSLQGKFYKQVQGAAMCVHCVLSLQTSTIVL